MAMKYKKEDAIVANKCTCNNCYKKIDNQQISNKLGGT